MPYARNADLPTTVRTALPGAAQALFRRAFNAAHVKNTEEIAMRIAWAAVSRAYKKPAGGGVWVHKVNNGPLFVKRIVENPYDIIKWAKEQGFAKNVIPRDMHVTLAYSRDAVDWPAPDDDTVVVKSHGGREVTTLGPNGAVVLKFQSPSLSRRWADLCSKGCSYDYDEYVPHVTLTYEPGDVDLSKVEPYKGPIVFGPEVHESVADEVDHVEKEAELRIWKYSKELGLVFGWSIICKEGGKEYYDLQGDHIPEDAMLEAASEFMQKRRTMKVMHKGEKVGEVVFAWPLTTEICKAMGVKSQVTGLMVAVKPSGAKILQQIKDGKLAGFSIGGQRLVDEDVEEAA